ncbi:MAG: regulatory protein RecX [Candidatus Poribacteria bacterium]|nr:MAG: regulatory protein RecX [Candidatus Poribacteria bacterium]
MALEIVAIHHIPHWSSRRQVELSNGEAFSLDAGLLLRHGLYIGRTLTPEELGAIRAEDERIRAKSAALDLLRLRPFTRREIEERLRRKGFGPAAVDYAIAELQRLELISDERFAQAYVSERMRNRPRGRRALRWELHRRGVDQETIDRVLRVLTVADEREAARRAAQRQARQYRTLPQEVARRRMYHFLLRRGFEYEVVREVLQELFPDEEPVRS